MYQYLKPFLSLLLIGLLSACGGGGGGDNNTTVTLSWAAPETREDNTALEKTDISGYAIVYFTESELDELQDTLFLSHYNKERFLEDPDIAYYLPSYYLPLLIETGSPNIILVPNGDETQYEFSNPDAGRYYFAVSAYDFDDIYSRLSQTKTITIN